MSAVGALEPIGISPVLISIRVLIPLINNMMTADRCRTVVIYYHNDTSDIANEVFHAIDTLRAPFISVNVDRRNYVPPEDSELGLNLFNICILKNIRTGRRQEQILNLVDLQVKNVHFIVILEKATDDEISEFFKLLWTEYKMSRVAAFFLGETVEVYTHFAYQNRFGVKMDEFHVSEPSLPANAFNKYFNGKLNDLENAKINVYMTENFPKTFQAPSRYRVTQSNFYFVGRDGLAAQTAQIAFNAQWQYKTLPANLVSRISPFDFSNESTSVTIYGTKLESDQSEPDNLEYVNVREGEPIS